MATKVPELSTLVHAAREIVLAARRQDDLGSLTVKTVRKQVERDFSLEEGTLDEGDIKTALRNAVKTALTEEMESNANVKRKRPTEDSAERGKVKPKKIQKKSKEQETKGKSDGNEGSGTVQKKRKPRIAKSKETIGTDSEDGEGAPAPGNATASTSKTKQTKRTPTKAVKKSKSSSGKGETRSADTENSDSERSVLTDEPPRKKRTKRKTKTSRESKPEKDPENAQSPDEETIKRLKSFVSACGVRKTWSKEFADIPLPKQQIARLKDILADLGMTGRYSLERAKAIKEKRALARELDDVVEFERKAGASRGNRIKPGNGKRIVAELDTNSEISESEYEDQDSSKEEKKNTASKSIMAYLANQSSDDE